MKAGEFDLSEPEPEAPGMLMTSMIDIIFILLAFFVCVTELKKGHLDVDVPEVPAVDANEPETDVAGVGWIEDVLGRHRPAEDNEPAYRSEADCSKDLKVVGRDVSVLRAQSVGPLR